MEASLTSQTQLETRPGSVQYFGEDGLMSYQQQEIATPQAIVMEARKYLGVPYKFRGLVASMNG